MGRRIEAAFVGEACSPEGNADMLARLLRGHRPLLQNLLQKNPSSEQNKLDLTYAIPYYYFKLLGIIMQTLTASHARTNLYRLINESSSHQ